MSDLQRQLPLFFAHHVLLTAVALGIAVVVSVPLGVVASRSARLAAPLLGVASVLQTIPGLALLALAFVPSASAAHAGASTLAYWMLGGHG